MTTSHQGLTLADLEWGLNSIQEARFALAAMYGLQVYEWFDCIGKEIKLIQRARWSSIKISYLLCRYYPLLCWPVVMWAYMGNHSSTTCAKVGKPVHILLFPYQCFSQGVMLMRAYAFTGRDRRVLMLLCTCYAILLGVNFWAFCTHLSMPPPEYFLFLGPMGCFPNYGSGVMAIRIGLSMLAATLMDLVSLITVLIYCKRQSAFKGGSLAEYFIGQGLGSFIIITIINVAAAIAFFKPPSFHSGLGIPLSVIVPNLIACRVILQLRRRVTLTPTELSRQYSAIVRFGLERMEREDESERDVWLMDSERATDSSPQDSIIPSILPRHCTVT
ncbi:hypothetical protein FA13DRAFT_1799296 [Coprinellus micaceus]|uniref:DUF6533 domain-containing protein n=1 Tax=Coprinellus micaceus TaxID=71717 RepID=A0A4Y7SJ96_COPMI|nr:hypothetical protein FA13DRAFT_1799296 [Coprinellus micaceus]